jgi:hypothetical protein
MNPAEYLDLKNKGLGMTQRVIKNQGFTIKHHWGRKGGLGQLLLNSGYSQSHPLMFIVGWTLLGSARAFARERKDFLETLVAVTLVTLPKYLYRIQHVFPKILAGLTYTVACVNCVEKHKNSKPSC